LGKRTKKKKRAKRGGAKPNNSGREGGINLRGMLGKSSKKVRHEIKTRLWEGSVVLGRGKGRRLGDLKHRFFASF